MTCNGSLITSLDNEEKPAPGTSHRDQGDTGGSVANLEDQHEAGPGMLGIHEQMTG